MALPISCRASRARNYEQSRDGITLRWQPSVPSLAIARRFASRQIATSVECPRPATKRRRYRLHALYYRLPSTEFRQQGCNRFPSFPTSTARDSRRFAADKRTGRYQSHRNALGFFRCRSPCFCAFGLSLHRPNRKWSRNPGSKLFNKRSIIAFSKIWSLIVRRKGEST